MVLIDLPAFLEAKGLGKGFRPLTGIMVLIMEEKTNIYKKLMGFRPLTGIMVLILLAAARKPSATLVVSVPLRGLWFLSDASSFLATIPFMFPSPYGDYGSYLRQSLLSPRLNSLVVSVPLRGLWFLSAPFINGFMKPLKWHFAGRIIYSHHFLSFARK